jgi:LysM repeat protein
MTPRIDGAAPVPAFDDWGSSSTVSTVRPKPGETLEQISQRLDVDPDALAEANPEIKDRQQVLTPFQEIKVPPGLDRQMPAEAVPIDQPSKSDQAATPMGDTLASSAVKANLYAAPPRGQTREKWIGDMAEDPGDAHTAWKNLSGRDRDAVLAKMEQRYGKDFVQQFKEEVKKGKPQTGTQNYQPGTGPSADQLKAMGYRKGWNVLGNGGVEIEYWVHPSGKRVARDISTWNSGATQGHPTESPSSSKGPENIDGVEPPTVDPLDEKREQAEGLAARLEDIDKQLKSLLESKHVPWKEVVDKLHEANDVYGKLKDLGAWSDDVNHPTTLDMSDVDESFSDRLMEIQQDLQDYRADADNRNPDFETLMQAPY